MSSSSRAPPRKSNGRRKVAMAKMENQSNLQVTFSKRRVGLFKKVSELCVLCGVEAAIIIFSPAKKAYCFGHPNVEHVINKFLGVTTSPRRISNFAANHELIVESHRNSNIRELNLELIQVENMLTAERNRGEELNGIMKTGHMQKWFPPHFDGFNHSQLLVLREAISDLKKNIEVVVNKDFIHANSHNSLAYYDSLMQKSENLKGFPISIGSSINGVPSFDGNSYSHELGRVAPYFDGSKEVFDDLRFLPVGINDSFQIVGSNHTNSWTRGLDTHDHCLASSTFRDLLDSTGMFSSGSGTAAASMLPYGSRIIKNIGSGLG